MNLRKVPRVRQFPLMKRNQDEMDVEEVRQGIEKVYLTKEGKETKERKDKRARKRNQPLCRDLLILLSEFLHTEELVLHFGLVCYDWNQARMKIRNRKFMTVRHKSSVPFCLQQRNLKDLSIVGVKNIELRFNDLPEYLHLGHKSGIYQSENVYNNVRVLFIDHADFEICIKSFPNLEELYIDTQEFKMWNLLDYNLPKLKKIIIRAKYGELNIGENNIFKYDLLALSEAVMLQDSNLYQEDYSDLGRLFRIHHKPPRMIMISNK